MSLAAGIWILPVLGSGAWPERVRLGSLVILFFISFIIICFPNRITDEKVTFG